MDQVVAIISSAISPSISQITGTDLHLIAPTSRLQQTKDTISSLTRLGIDNIFLVDGSGENWQTGWASHLAPAKVFVQPQSIFTNKGILELLLLLNATSQIPCNAKILKLSGRYTLNKRLDMELMDGDFVFKRYSSSKSVRGNLSVRPGMKFAHVSTIAYAVRNREIFEALLLGCLREVFGYQTRIVGPRSLLRLIRNSIFAKRDRFPYHDPPVSIELAMLRALDGFRGVFVDDLGVSGVSGQNGRQYSE